MPAPQLSFAFDGRGGEWRWYEENGVLLPPTEIGHHAEIINASEGEVAKANFWAMIRKKLQRAAQGRLVDPGDGRSNIFKAVGIRELAWREGRDQWRLYYCEPLELQSERVMLALMFNRKIDKAQQDQDITEAVRRWNSWKTPLSR